MYFYTTAMDAGILVACLTLAIFSFLNLLREAVFSVPETMSPALQERLARGLLIAMLLSSPASLYASFTASDTGIEDLSHDPANRPLRSELAGSIE